MSIEQTITRLAEAIEANTEALLALAQNTPAAAAPAEKAAPATKDEARKPKAKAPVEKPKKEEKAPEPEAESALVDEDDAPAKVTRKEVSTLVLEHVKKVGRSDTEDVLAAFGATRVSELSADDYADVADRLREGIEAAK